MHNTLDVNFTGNTHILWGNLRSFCIAQCRDIMLPFWHLHFTGHYIFHLASHTSLGITNFTGHHIYFTGHHILHWASHIFHWASHTSLGITYISLGITYFTGHHIYFTGHHILHWASHIFHWASHTSLGITCMSRDARKPDFCICENKDADQLRGNPEADHAFVFATRIVQPLYFLNLKFQVSSLIQ